MHNVDVRKATAVGNTVAAAAFAVRSSGLQSRRVSARGAIPSGVMLGARGIADGDRGFQGQVQNC